jgi:hypothetical protein
VLMSGSDHYSLHSNARSSHEPGLVWRWKVQQAAATFCDDEVGVSDGVVSGGASEA